MSAPSTNVARLVRRSDANSDGWGTPPPMDVETGSGFGYYERLFSSYDDGAVMDYGDVEARDLHEMQSKDYKGRQIENVLTLPILSAEHTIDGIKGDTGEAEWLNEFWQLDPWAGGCSTDLDEIIGQSLAAITYKRSYFELVFHPSADGKHVVYKKVAQRPATTCRLRRNPDNGGFEGFEQDPRILFDTNKVVVNRNSNALVIPRNRAFVHIHGTRHDPLWGTSDMEIAYWCWATKQKLLFLWMQFLENVALPRTIVKAADLGLAQQVARRVAQLRNSGVLPVSTGNDPEAVHIETQDISGKGAEQFSNIITWLDQAATNSVLAGFLDLTGQAVSARTGLGSFALSKDASSYFFASREADTRELERSIRRYLFAPLIRYNFGPKAKVPRLQFEPLVAEDKTNAMALLNTMITARANPGAIPDEFIASLAGMVGQYVGLDSSKVEDDFRKAADRAKAAAAANPNPAANSPAGQQVGALGGAAQRASELVSAEVARRAAAGEPAAGPRTAPRLPVSMRTDGGAL